MSNDADVFAAGIVPVVVLEHHDRAADLGRALIAGGIPVAEITFRTAAAARSIEAMAELEAMTVGAGTVVTPDQVDQAVDAGARFVVSPGLLPAVVERAQERGVPIIPGAVTPSEIMLALSLGLTTLKFFPADIYGGPAAIKALGAPFRQVSFVPTGGVNTGNLADYLALPNVVAVGGTWMVKPDLIAAGDFARITELSRTATASVTAVRSAQ